MIETIKHLLGFCGEPHGLAYILLTGGSFLSGVFYYVLYKIKGDKRCRERQNESPSTYNIISNNLSMRELSSMLKTKPKQMNILRD